MTFSSGDLAPPIDPVTESTARVNVRAILRSVSLTLGPAPLGNKPDSRDCRRREGDR